jgi:hypothetical protein
MARDSSLKAMHQFAYVDHGESPHWPGKPVFKVIAGGILEADRQFEIHLGQDPRRLPLVGCQILPIPIGEILMASGLFSSRSDCLRAIKGKSVKVNRVIVDSFDEPLEQGDFINFMWLPHSAQFIRAFGRGLLTIHKGKKACIVQVSENEIKVIVQ